MEEICRGRIEKGVGGLYWVNTAQGIFECPARGLFRLQGETPLVGDFVQLESLDLTNMTAYIYDIEPRKNELLRPRVANVDIAVVTIAAAKPAPNPMQLDKLLILCAHYNVEILLCVNKMDLVKKAGRELIESYERAGFRMICVSSKTGENIDALKDKLVGRVSVFAGPSGVGKSSVINAIMPGKNLATSEISRKIERGKHTTRHTELMRFDENSYIVDAPGFTSLDLSGIEPEKLPKLYPEFAPFAGGCYYADCLHVSEHDCAVKSHVGAEVPTARYERYLSILEELQTIEREKWD